MLPPPMILTLVTMAVLQASSGNPRLDEARALTDDFEYAGALKALDQALAVVGNDRDTTLAIYELQGIVWGNLNKGPKARAAFTTLLTLDPDRKLSGDNPPRVRTPFFEAKEIVNKTGPIKFERLPVHKEGDQIASVGVGVTHDSVKLVRQVRFHTLVGDQSRVIEVPLTPPGKAEVPAVATEVKWWAELMGDKGAVLMLLGAPDKPLLDTVVEPVAPPTPPPTPAAELFKPSEPTAPTGPPAWLRPTGIGLAGAGLVAAGVGVYFGVTSTSARQLILKAAGDPTGTTITQVQAKAADQRARESALIANTLMGTAAGLAALGVVFFLVGGQDDVAIAPTGTGVTVSGRF